MKTNHLLVMFVCFFFFSCNKEEINTSESGLNESEANLDESYLRVTPKSISQDAEYVLNQLRGIPVHIFFPQNVVTGASMQLSCNTVNSGVTLKSTDDGSGRQRWLIDRKHPAFTWDIKAIGGYPVNSPYLSTNNGNVHMGPFSTGSGEPQLALWYIHFDNDS